MNSEEKLGLILAQSRKWARCFNVREVDDFVQDCARRHLEHPNWDRTKFAAIDWRIREIRDLQRGDVYGGGTGVPSDKRLEYEHDYLGPMTLQEARERLSKLLRSRRRGVALRRGLELLEGDYERYAAILELSSETPSNKDLMRYRDAQALIEIAGEDETSQNLVATIVSRILAK